MPAPEWLNTLPPEERSKWLRIMPDWGTSAEPGQVGTPVAPQSPSILDLITGLGGAIGNRFGQAPDVNSASVAENIVRGIVGNVGGIATAPFRAGQSVAASAPGLFTQPEAQWRAGPAAPPAPAGPAPVVNPANINDPRLMNRSGMGPTGPRNIEVPITIPPPVPPPQLPTMAPIPSVTAPTLPAAPTLSTPTPIGGPGPIDFSKFDAALAGAKPGASSNLANVLQGLAGGAASVSASEGGAFARALAAAGAGGAGGLAKSNAEMRDYSKLLASGEFDKLGMTERQKDRASNIAMQNQRLKQEVELQNARLTQDRDLTQARFEDNAANRNSNIAIQNAQNQYNRDIKQMEMDYSFKQESRQMAMPVIKHDANGITIQTTDDKGKVNLQYHPTKTMMDQVEKLKPTFEAFGLNTDAAEAAETKWIMDQNKGNPFLVQGALTQLTVRHTISKGAGPAVFGDLYEKATKSATKQLQTENPTLVTKPEVYQAALNERITAIILADPRISNLAWLKRALPHSGAARIMLGADPSGQ